MKSCPKCPHSEIKLDIDPKINTTWFVLICKLMNKRLVGTSNLNNFGRYYSNHCPFQ